MEFLGLPSITHTPQCMVGIDKYTQISRILNPIVLTIEQISVLAKNDQINSYITTAFGSTKQLRKLILHDFFTRAFDGSGGDNFFDAGQC